MQIIHTLLLLLLYIAVKMPTAFPVVMIIWHDSASVLKEEGTVQHATGKWNKKIYCNNKVGGDYHTSFLTFCHT